MGNGSISRETHFNKTKQETQFHLIMPNFINVLSTRCCFGKVLMIAVSWRKQSPGFQCDVFAGDYKEFILIIC